MKTVSNDQIESVIERILSDVLGKTVYVVGDTTTSSITLADLLILGSGSGKTISLLAMAGQAQRLGAKILLFTTDANSPLAELADQRVVIPATSLKTAEEGAASYRRSPWVFCSNNLCLFCATLSSLS
jgi:6-phospho-3-hexuloisomerase